LTPNWRLTFSQIFSGEYRNFFGVFRRVFCLEGRGRVQSSLYARARAGSVFEVALAVVRFASLHPAPLDALDDFFDRIRFIVTKFFSFAAAKVSSLKEFIPSIFENEFEFDYFIFSFNAVYKILTE